MILKMDYIHCMMGSLLSLTMLHKYVKWNRRIFCTNTWCTAGLDTFITRVSHSHGSAQSL